jgi:hydrogenase maturation protease
VNGKTLVIGLGNTLLCDDGAGIYAARKIAAMRIDCSNIDVVEASIGGVGLLDLMTGYDRVVILDAIFTGKNAPGEIYQLSLDDFGSPSHQPGPHFLDVRTSIELGYELGLSMPKKIIIFAIEIHDNTTFIEKLTREVDRALPLFAEHVFQYLKANS